MTDPTTRKVRTITLTDRRPVTIAEDEWPVIADAREKWHDGGEFEFQANRKRACAIRVRQREGASAQYIVYGTYDYSSNWQNEDGVNARAGYLLREGTSEDELPEVIQNAGRDLIERGADADLVRKTVVACIADLPAEDLT